jgi:hypothetical protein
MRRVATLLATCLLFVASPASAEQPQTQHVQTVHAFIAAFNAHDSAAMAKLVTEDIQWLSISADTIATETSGRTALVSGMNDYFASCPTCRSELADVIASTDRVSAVEVASWQGKDGAKSQKGLSVYEFAEGLIRRVYYFPVER